MGRTYRARKNKSLQRNSDPPSPSIHHDLLKFLSLRGWHNENQLTVSAFPFTGRGLNAKRNLSAHDLIIELPHQCLVSYLTLESDDRFAAMFNPNELETAKSVVTFQSLLALYLLHQVLLGIDSEWLPYIRTLPESFSTPYFLKKTELYFLPENLLERIVEQNETVKSNFQALMNLLKPEEREKFELETFKWAYFVCNSRSVFISASSLEPLVDRSKFKELLTDSANMALAPYLDLLNHSDKAITKSQLTHSEGSIAKSSEKIKSGTFQLGYQLQTMKPVKKFDQIFINYGNYNNSKLLLEYGFVLPNNEMDFLEFTLEDIQSYLKAHTELRTLLIPKHKYKFVRDHDLSQQMFIEVTEGLNHNFQAVLAILLVPQNIYNLTQVAFGDALDFSVIKTHAMEIVRRKRLNFENLSTGLGQQQELSGSGAACMEYYRESIRLIDKVLALVGKL